MPYNPSLDHVAVVTAARSRAGLPPLGQTLTAQQAAEVCLDAACRLRALGEDACLLAGKSDGQNHGDIQGEQVATDIVCYPSTGVHWDCLVDDGRYVGWQDKGAWVSPLFAFAPTCGGVEPPTVTLETLDVKVQNIYDHHGWALDVLMRDVAAIKAKLGVTE